MHAASQLPGGKLTDVDDVGLHLHVNLNADDNDDFYTLNFKPLARFVNGQSYLVWNNNNRFLVTELL